MAFVGRESTMAVAAKRSRTSLDGPRTHNSHIHKEGLLGAMHPSPIFPFKSVLNRGLYIPRNYTHKRSTSVQNQKETPGNPFKSHLDANLHPYQKADLSVVSVDFPGSNRTRRSLSPAINGVIMRKHPRSSSITDSPGRVHTSESPLLSSNTVDNEPPLPSRPSVFLPSSETRIPLAVFNLYPVKDKQSLNSSPLKAFPRHVFNGRHYRKPLSNFFVP